MYGVTVVNPSRALVVVGIAGAVAVDIVVLSFSRALRPAVNRGFG